MALIRRGDSVIVWDGESAGPRSSNCFFSSCPRPFVLRLARRFTSMSGIWRLSHNKLFLMLAPNKIGRANRRLALPFHAGSNSDPPLSVSGGGRSPLSVGCFLPLLRTAQRAILAT